MREMHGVGPRTGARCALNDVGELAQALRAWLFSVGRYPWRCGGRVLESAGEASPLMPSGDSVGFRSDPPAVNGFVPLLEVSRGRMALFFY